MPYVLLYLAVEIVAVVALGSAIGLAWTLLVLLAGSVLGLWLARREGLRAVEAISAAVSRGTVAHAELTDGLLVAAGGVLLFIPGLVTDLAGLLLVLPPTRGPVRRLLVRAAERRSPGLRTARIRSDATIVEGVLVEEAGAGDAAAGHRSGSAGREPGGAPLVIEGTIVRVGPDQRAGHGGTPPPRA